RNSQAPGRLSPPSRPGENNKSKKLPWNSLYDWYRKRGQVNGYQKFTSVSDYYMRPWHVQPKDPSIRKKDKDVGAALEECMFGRLVY
ncbi:MAG: hypothetical protein ABSF14_20070, partial [Terriglobia bacterium]